MCRFTDILTDVQTYVTAGRPRSVPIRMGNCQTCPEPCAHASGARSGEASLSWPWFFLILYGRELQDHQRLVIQPGRAAAEGGKLFHTPVDHFSGAKHAAIVERVFQSGRAVLCSVRPFSFGNPI